MPAFTKLPAIAATRPLRYDFPMHVRPMETGDCAAVATIHTFTWQSAYRGIVAQSFLDAIDTAQREASWRRGVETNSPEILRIVAEHKGAVIGFACGGANRTPTELPNCDAELWAIYVHPEKQGLGAGQKLVRAFNQSMKAAGKTRVAVWALEENAPARKFYEKLGGRRAATKKTKIGEQSLPEVGYELPLG